MRELLFLLFFCCCAFSTPSLPLSTSGSWLVDSDGTRVVLSCYNWYGTDQKDYVVGGLQWQELDKIASQTAEWGFNCVRLPWSNEMLETDPLPNQTVVEANPDLLGLSAMQILDKVIVALASEVFIGCACSFDNKKGLMIILDNHMSDADWCCSLTDENGLW